MLQIISGNELFQNHFMGGKYSGKRQGNHKGQLLDSWNDFVPQIENIDRLNNLMTPTCKSNSVNSGTIS
jgi:hypothetical protein